MIFKWKEDFETGISEIDTQHKRLFELGSELYNLVKVKTQQDKYDDIVTIIEELKDYAIYHFKYEENYMKEINFKDLKEHRIKHNVFIEKILEYETDDIDYNQTKVLLDMINFIASWISNHILKDDLKYR
ncbi:putative bacteriohemerythrin [Gottschalkia purinilytica]|uniref:Putative bacteriohemerythrin n=1 Tax=Gottschalkia purinilytica TaxID=1503 RepID=A0A0L0WD76_GOTPU|nr:bacteriohemerythrin [Gottschalkia purinilytica]KNF09380.1 putative bacteriohemerythrin [Gottschalkia purinilytica]